LVDERPFKPRNARWGGRYVHKRKVCAFCQANDAKVDYKEAGKLQRYISDRGKIEPRRRTGTCARHQRALAIAIKRARHIAILPYVSSHIRRTGGIGVGATG
jgi:small subunit ribosomal protein S18